MSTLAGYGQSVKVMAFQHEYYGLESFQRQSTHSLGGLLLAALPYLKMVYIVVLLMRGIKVNRKKKKT